MPKPTSSLQHDYTQTPHPASSSGKQFASTPRFTFSSSSRKSLEVGGTNERQHSSSSPLIQRRAPSRPREDIDELASDEEDDTKPKFLPRPMAPLCSDEIPNEDDSSSPYPRSTARKRPLEQEQTIVSSSPPPSSSSSLPETPQLYRVQKSSPSPPTTPPPLLTSTSVQPPRFRLPTHSSPTSSIKSKPTFVLPTATASPPRTRASTLLTPQKRGQKFEQGGLAATVRDWIVETSQPLYQNRHRVHDDWDLKLHIEEARKLGGLGNSMLVKTKETNRNGATGKGWVLTGNGKGAEDIQGLLRRGLIGVRRPFWDVQFGGEGWGVAPEWSNLTNTC